MTMMITRTLLAALCCAYASGLSPLAPLNTVGDNSDCALYLHGPGRTSAYDYSINLLKGNFGYEGQSNCITFEAINQAYLEARNRILVSQPKGDWKAEDFASVGELILDISTNLARRYGLTYEEIEKGLPLIDTSRTLIREVCPPIFSHVECRAGKYRRLDGLCNNLQHPTWGATMAPFQRLIGPLFADGINAPRIAHHGKDLPLSRVVSRTMHPDEGFHDHAGTVMVIAWGQFMDHDYTLTATPLDPVNRNDPEECCKRPPHLKHPYCNEIRIPDDDYFYRLFGVKCIDFVRGFPSPRPGCRLGSRNPFNTLTGAIDGNTVYGVTEKFARKLRTGFGGLLRMNPVFKEYGLKDLLPLKLDIPDEGCTRPNKNMYCFEAGEIRVNEQLVLTVMHTLMAREHNRVANALAEVNPHWDDETLFQEARRINIAEIQHITYNEFLPILLGKDVMEKFGLVLEKQGYWDGYDPDVNPDVIASFAAAAYRFGHSLLPTAVERWSKAHKFIASKRLSDLIRRPYDLYRAGVLDEYVMGLMNQVAQAMDDSITQEVTNHLFKKVGARFGMDLVSFNMQRGREFGLPGYMEFRKFCGLPSADTFQDLFGSMPNATVQKYETIFDHPIDVDLWSGGVSERPLPGSMLGPTFACIIATQFSYSRRGDRFWFELPNQPSSFTSEQLVEIRKARLARVICDNTDIIDTVQLYPMVLPDHELNPRVPCRSGIIPQMDFSKWAEAAPFRGAAKQFMTNATVFENNGTSSDKVNTTATTNEETQNTSQGEIKTSSHTEEDKNQDKDKNTTTIQKHLENDPKVNQAVEKDTVLNYVYKKGEVEIPSKSTGHYKNSLKRRKRSPIESHSNSPLPSKFQKAAVIVDYETSHGPNTGRNSHFNIGTRNDNSNRDSADESLDEASSESNERDDYKLRRGNKKYTHDSDENDERDDYSNRKNENSNENENYRHTKSSPINDDSGERDPRTHREGYRNRKPRRRQESIKRKRVYKPSNEREDSGERDHYSRKSSRERENSGERADYINNRSNLANNYNNAESDENKSNGRFSSPNSDSRESQENQKYHPSSIESKESVESNNNYRHNVSPHNRDQDNARKSRYDQEDTSYESPNAGSSEHKKTENLESSENSSESNERTKENSKLQNSSPAPISDVDLNDFSYERIHVNKDGKVEPQKENLDETDPNSSVEILPTSTPTPEKETNIKNIINTLTAIHTIPKPVVELNNDKLVSINDGEVRPVVEINSEIDSGSSEENTKASLSTSGEGESLESILGVKEPENLNHNDQNNKIVSQKEVPNGDVKQQFERIPLNYKHNEKDQKKDLPQPDIKQIEATETPKDENVNLFNNPGTLDVFKPEVRYDDKLNIKFDDVAVTLPEIKLPDDILAYTRENSPYNNENQEHPKPDSPKYSPYYYNYDDKEAPAPQKKKNDDEDTDDEPRYYGYYGEPDKKQSYKKKNADDEEDEEEEEEEEEQEDEDLYEKFVRERFGKRGTFEKRTEQLQQEPADPQLYKTIKNILKKTAEIDEQAKQSGDPNAGYAWTLEYGEKL